MSEQLAATPAGLGDAEDAPGRLARMEAALRLVVDHIHTTSRAAELIQAEQTRTVLTAMSLGISATSILALLSLSAVFPDRSTGLLGLTQAMSLIFLGSALDLSAGGFLRKAVTRALQTQDGSDVTLQGGPWYQVLRRSFWGPVRRSSSDLFYFWLTRSGAVVVYVIGLVYTLTAVFFVYRPSP